MLHWFVAILFAVMALVVLATNAVGVWQARKKRGGYSMIPFLTGIFGAVSLATWPGGPSGWWIALPLIADISIPSFLLVALAALASCSSKEEPTVELTHEPSTAALMESSTSFDTPNLQPFLERLVPLVESGFGQAEVAEVMAAAVALKHNAEAEFSFNIRNRDTSARLEIGLFADDFEVVDVYFMSPPQLAKQIDAEIVSYFDELGM